jgi:hypothetical protein
MWPELHRVSRLRKADAIHAADPLEAAATLYRASKASRDSCVQTDHGSHGMDPVEALGTSAALSGNQSTPMSARARDLDGVPNKTRPLHFVYRRPSHGGD